jgi:hypothetical protein
VKNSVNVPVLLLAFIQLCLITCSPNSHDQLAGGATGTEVSAISGTIVNDDGSPAVYATIKLRPADYITDSSTSTGYCSLHSILDTKTDLKGNYKIDSVIPGSYRIEAISSNDTLGVIIDLNVVTNSPVVNVPQSKLLPMAEISGEIQINYTSESRGEIQIYGVERDVVTDSNGMFRIRVPVGAHNLHIKTFTDSPSIPLQNIESMDVHLHVESGEMRDIGTVHIYSSQSKPCQDGKCDSLALLEILDTLKLAPAMFDSVSRWQGGRIVTLNFRNVKIQTVPKKIMKFSRVTSIDLGNTGISYLFHEIGYMRNLTALYLDSNILNELPNEIGNLNNCRILDLSGNMIRFLPGSITKLYPAELLDLEGNRFCTLDSAMAAWATKFDPDWKATQVCDH